MSKNKFIIPTKITLKDLEEIINAVPPPPKKPLLYFYTWHQWKAMEEAINEHAKKCKINLIK